MINLKFKYSFVIFTYIVLIILIILSYIAIVPDEDIPILRNNEEIFKVIENKFVKNENSVYEILEKKNTKKDIEEIIDNEIILNNEKKQNKSKFRLQFASFKDIKKSENVAKRIKSEYFNDNEKNLLVKKITLQSDEIFFRVLTNDLYEYKSAQKLCALIRKKFQCIIIKETE